MLYRIMVVDDEILIAEGVAQMVREMEGWELDVENAFSARQALELAQKRRFDLIVLDVQMPSMNGLEMLRALRGGDNRAQVIFLTAYSDYSYMREAMQLGAFDYVLKIDGLKALRESVRRALTEHERALDEMAGRLRGLSQSDGRMREAAVREAFFRDEAGNARFLVIAGVCVNAPFPGGVEQRRAEIFLETSLCELLGAAAYSEPMGDGASLWLIRLAAEMPPPGVEESIAQAAELAEKETGLIFNFSVGRACVARAEIAAAYARLVGRARISEREPVVLGESPDALLRADSPGDLLSTLKKYVRAHRGGDLSLSALAGILHVNASYLSRLFSRGCGQTLTEYVTDERMRAACALLRDTQWQIQEIAARVGFDSASYFTNVFRRRLGISPQKYREDARGGRRR